MVVYLDPSDYEEESKAKKIKKNDFMRNESPDRLAMKTTANFFRRKNIRYDENDVEIIKVEGNSDRDKSDIISENSDGLGWFKEDDRIN